VVLTRAANIWIRICTDPHSQGLDYPDPKQEGLKKNYQNQKKTERKKIDCLDALSGGLLASPMKSECIRFFNQVGTRGFGSGFARKHLDLLPVLFRKSCEKPSVADPG
jgi:hypothetical protein